MMCGFMRARGAARWFGDGAVRYLIDTIRIEQCEIMVMKDTVRVAFI